MSNLQAGIKSRSVGVKLIVVCGLALLMTIPALFVGGLIEDRTERAADVMREISGHVGGQQTFLGPTLAIPYNIPSESRVDFPKRGMYLVFPERASAVLKIITEERRRSLFKVPVFQADLKLDATFDLSGVPATAPQGAELDWSRAEIVVGVSDARGALADAILTTNGRTSTLVPSGIAQNISLGGDQKQPIKLTLFGAKIEGTAKPNAQFNVTSILRFSGAQRIAVLAYGKTTHLTAQGDWPSPGFDGGFLPVNRTLSRNGFTSEWSVPFIARGVRAEGDVDSITGLDASALGVSFIEVADPYQSVNRSLKYLLVGMAQIIFYLLLLALAERIGFDLGFLIAGTATVVLLSANAGWVFSSRSQQIRALAIFTLLYVLIYVLLRLEDNALLVGAAVSFLTVPAAMYFTRGIDWYSSLLVTGVAEHQATPQVPRNTE